MNIAIIDNYDSFTYNLSHIVKESGAKVTVLRNDCFRLSDLKAFDKLILSPGPGIPKEAGLLLETIRTYAGKRPILGVCLGHQAIAEVFGAHLINLPSVYHGIQTPCHLEGNDYLFAGLPETISVGRYHSWIVDKYDFPKSLEVIAHSNEGGIMAIRHRFFDLRGIQFHPESILTPDGKTMIRNWLEHHK